MSPRRRGVVWDRPNTGWALILAAAAVVIVGVAAFNARSGVNRWRTATARADRRTAELDLEIRQVQDVEVRMGDLEARRDALRDRIKVKVQRLQRFGPGTVSRRHLTPEVEQQIANLETELEGLRSDQVRLNAEILDLRPAYREALEGKQGLLDERERLGDAVRRYRTSARWGHKLLIGACALSLILLMIAFVVFTRP